MSFAMFFISAENGICSFLSLVMQWFHYLYLFVLYLELLHRHRSQPVIIQDLLPELASRNPSWIRRNQPETFV
jgi:hypothetical protein